MKVTDEQLLADLPTMGIHAIAKKYDMRGYAVEKRIASLKKKGLLSPDFAASRQTARKVPDDKTLRHQYLDLGWGVYKISKECGACDEIVRRHLKRLGILETERANLLSAEKSRRISRRPKSKEFLDSTKKIRFQQEQGICEICHKQIGNGLNWRLATYHHRKPVKEGGGREPENCMVLHRECHEDNFYELHGFEYPYGDKTPEDLL